MVDGIVSTTVGTSLAHAASLCRGMAKLATKKWPTDPEAAYRDACNDCADAIEKLAKGMAGE